MSDPFLELRGVNLWRGEEAEVAALSELSLELRLGESVAILGPNGSGKSSLLGILTGALRPELPEGGVCRLFGRRRWVLDRLRDRIGVVMPEEVARFDDDETAWGVVLSTFRHAYGLVPGMRFSRADKQRARAAVVAAGVDELALREFGGLSSGERRRFLIARALAPDPEVLVLDEPTTALDFAAATALGATLRGLAREGRTLVWVTHHPGEIPPEVGRVVMLKEGRVFADGPKRELLRDRPLSELFGLPLRARWNRGWCEVQAGGRD